METGVSILYISHDLDTVRAVCDRAAVMRSGEIVETEETNTLLKNPTHPYTKELLSSAI